MKNKVLKIFSIIFILVLTVAFFSGCQSTDKSESYFDTTGIQVTKFDYNSTENKTKVTWAATLSNGTIYNIDSFSVTFKLYSGDTMIDTVTYNYNQAIKHGKEYTGAFYFYENGIINKIEYISWTAHYKSFWETYKTWIIVSIIVVAILAIIYLILMIILGLNFEDIFIDFEDFCEEHGWILTPLIFPFATLIYSSITDNWMPLAIVGIATISLILIILLMHFIQFIIFNANPKIRKKTRKIFRKQKNKNNDEPEKIEEDKKNNETTNSTKQTRKYKSTITFADIAGLENAKKIFKEKVVNAFKHKELYEKYGKKVGGGILLYGLPGTGKTMFAEAASNETNSLFIPIKCSDIKSKWYGESESNIKKIFDKARNSTKAIIFFDEFEAIGAKRTDNSDNANNELVPQILAEMQGINKKSNSVIVVIAATNKPWAIDSAFLRPGRFDEKIYIPLPDMEARTKLFELKLNNIPTKDIDYNEIAKLTDGFNGADITEFCEKLKLNAINKSIESNAEHIIDMNDVYEVAKTIKSSVSDEDLELLKEFESKY